MSCKGCVGFWVVLLLVGLGWVSLAPQTADAQTGAVQPGARSAQAAVGTSLLGRVLVPRPTDAAVDSIRAALDRQPNDTTLLIAAGQAYDRVWQFEEAITLYSKAISIAPTKPRALSLRGQRYLSLRRFDRAIADLEQARDLAPRSFHPLFHLGLAYYFSGRYADAAAAFASCVDLPQRTPAPVAGKDRAPTLRQCDNLYEGQRYALASWRSLALVRDGHFAEARQLLEKLPPPTRPKEGDGQWYFDAVDIVLGRKPDSLWTINGTNGGGVLTVGYAVASLAFAKGDAPKACRILREMVNREEWPAFGFIGAEVDLARGRCNTTPAQRPPQRDS